MCGIVGIVGQDNVNTQIYDALTVLQHRGQDAAGIVTCDGRRLQLRKDKGLVREVFQTRHMLRLKGNMGIGHVRYPTAGNSSSEEAQPFYVNAPFGISLAHNGNLVNTEQLMQELYEQDKRHINTHSDSEVLLNIFAHELSLNDAPNLTPQIIFDAVKRVHARCQGGYAAVAMINGYGIVAFRDPFGIRPVGFGRREGPDGIEVMVASESVAFDVLGFERVRDLQPGEALFIDMDGQAHTQQCAHNWAYAPCIFEYVYLARPDSIIDEVSVYKARLRMGERLTDKILREFPDNDIDVVIPVPDTSRTAASPLAYGLGVKLREGFIKNRYIGRTFIMPGQTERRKSVRQKLNAIPLEFEGKNVLLVDDSIVRGTTSKEIVQMARDSGANRVYFASASPPIRYANVYGIDMPSKHELIAAGRTTEDIAKAIGADRLFFQDLPDLIDAVRHGNPEIKQFDTSCFTGEYITGGVTEGFLMRQEQTRNDDSKAQSNTDDSEVLELRNAV
jgi:amidophosphoribosyltransferase